MTPSFARRIVTVLKKSPALKGAIEKSGLRDRYLRHSSLRNLSVPVISSRANFDAARSILTLRGSWQDIGRQLSEATDLVSEFDFAQRFMAGLSQHEQKEVQALLEECSDHIDDRFPELSGLVEGAAKASPQFDQQTVLLSTFWSLLIDFHRFTRSCSSCVVRTPHETLLGQNLDLGPSNNVILCYVVPDTGPNVLCHLMPGSLYLGMGINQFGVVMGGGSVNVERKWFAQPKALPTGFADLIVLQRSKSAEEASQVYAGAAPFGPVHDGNAVLALDKNQNLIRIEASHETVSSQKVSGEVKFATNHFQTDALADLNRKSDETSQMMLENSCERIQLADDWCKRATVVTKEHLKSLLRSEKGSGAWNRKARASDVGWTTATYLFDPQRACIDYVLGTKPVSKAWKTADLSPLFEGKTDI